jgi:hypothetical protein
VEEWVEDPKLEMPTVHQVIPQDIFNLRVLTTPKSQRFIYRENKSTKQSSVDRLLWRADSTSSNPTRVLKESLVSGRRLGSHSTSRDYSEEEMSGKRSPDLRRGLSPFEEESEQSELEYEEEEGEFEMPLSSRATSYRELYLEKQLMLAKANDQVTQKRKPNGTVPVSVPVNGKDLFEVDSARHSTDEEEVHFTGRRGDDEGGSCLIPSDPPRAGEAESWSYSLAVSDEEKRVSSDSLSLFDPIILPLSPASSAGGNQSQAWGNVFFSGVDTQAVESSFFPIE